MNDVSLICIGIS